MPPLPLRRELTSLLRLAAPLSIASGGQALLGLTDAAVLGRAGAVPLAGAGLANALFFAVAVVGMGLMMSLDPLIAQARGARDEARARRLLWQGVWLSLGAGTLLALPLAALPLLLEPLGIEPPVARAATSYLLLRIPGAPALLLYFALRAFLQAHGSTRPMVVATAAANVANLGLDLLFVFGGASLPAWTGPLRLVPAMGAAGAAAATTLVTFLQAAILVASVRALSPAPPPTPAAATPLHPDLHRRPPIHPPASHAHRRPSRADLAQAIRVGLPIGLHMGAEVGVFSLAGFLAARLGAEAMSAHQIALTIASFSFTMAIGIGNAGSVRVGLAVGAGDTAAARRSGLVAFGAGGAVMALFALAFFLAPRALARLMSDDPAVVAAAAPLLVVAAVFQISDGVQGIGAGVLRGAGDTNFTFAANMLGHYLCGLPVAVLLGLVLDGGVRGLWWGLCTGLTAVALALFTRFLRISSRQIVPLERRVGRVTGS